MAAKNQQKRFAPKLKIKKGDRVVVIAGAYKDRSKVREVLEVFPDENRAIVDQVNIVKRHTKPTQNSQGGIIEKPAPIHLSRLMLVDPKTGEPTRVGRKLEDGKLVRYSKKSGETFK
ncbi:MAG: 50S ribosomal protein L24 [Saprospiraceae bacterium]|jgi:large subunit ribosomal protein L24|nr:50S ribosomal protein L24 [Saprospiraceae bacterium]HRD80867.1 50S ribosomal protein L24 [Saprospiraceae bacterium]HRF40218.1 50S ribosomal protein L24 [Saprospiraceae bacterium]HRJ13603.1 50S ribosomal protein L24 [Saprospiraceae bacterium]HRK83219.1 50S ribosomal protein L24 [Saprospiraceae bacterium]